MADDRRKAKYQPNSIVASAQLLDTSKITRLPDASTEAGELWHYYADVPEVQFAVSWLSNAMSRCRLVAAVRGESGDEPLPIVEPEEVDELPEGQEPEDPLGRDEQAAFDVMTQFAGGTAGQSRILADATIQLVVPGMGYLVGEPTGRPPESDDETPGPETWQVLSADELSIRAGRLSVMEGEGQGEKAWRKLAEDALALKFWRPDPRHHFKPRSTIAGTKVVLRELELLTMKIDADAVSRLAGNGLLLIASEISFPVSAKNKDSADPFMAELVDSMITPISNRDSASAVVPLPVRVPGEYIDKVKHITFSSPLDDKAMALRDEAVRRFAAGVDMPAEIVTGLADSNHWTAWQIEESAIKLHIEPMLEAIAHALTIGYLQPALRALGITNPDLIVWFDVSELSVRPDRSGDAKEVFGLGGISTAALLRETGFGEADRPSPEEEQRNLLIRLVTGAPSLAPALLPLLGIDVDPSLFPGMEPAAPADSPQPEDKPVEGPPGTRDDEPPPPDEDGEAEAALLAAADAIVVRALERAGAKLTTLANKAGAHVTCDRYDVVHTCVAEEMRTQAVDALLAGAWERVPEIAKRYDVEPLVLQATLEGYTRGLILAGWPHDFEALSTVLGAGV